MKLPFPPSRSLASLLLLATLSTLAFPAIPVRAAAPAATTWHTSSFDHVLGTSLELKFEAPTAADATLAETAALTEIDRLDHLLSGYDPTSEFSRWAATRNAPVRISPELFEVLALFDTWRDRTSGALDASAETAGRLWQTAAQRHQVPTPAELQQAVALAHQTHWRLDPAAHTATHLTSAPLRLNSFAKSYIIDHAALAALRTGRVTSAVVNLGGDLVIRGRATDTVAVADPAAAAENDDPLAHLTLRDRAIATSGDYRRGLTIGGQWYSHLVDPRTALPATLVHSATVISPSATNAGALATALCVLPPSEGATLARTYPDTEYLIILADGSRLSSPGWTGLAQPATRPTPGVFAAVAPASSTSPSTSSSPATTPAAAASPSPSPPSAAATPASEVIVNVEVASIAGGRVRRPFLAVWIEDKNHFPVRNLALWFNRDRWLHELREWNHAEDLRDKTLDPRDPVSISSATRGPGKYTLRWDGKDDTGKLIPPGAYTLKIEVAREHGSHQLTTASLDTTGPAQRVALASNPELSALSWELRRPTASP